MKNVFKKFIAVIISAVIMLSLTCCEIDKTQAQVNNNASLNIVTTIFPYFDFTKNVAGDRANIKMLISPGAEVHNFEPSPSDIISIENCDLFIYNGGESDEWVEKILASLDGKVNVLRMFDYVSLLGEDEIEFAADDEHTDHDHNHEHHDHEHNEEEEYDEHIWTSPKNAATLSRAIADKLCEIDEKNADTYKSNLKEYGNQLSIVDNSFRQAVENGARNKIVVADRFPFLYFTQEYGLDYSCAFPGCSSQTEPSVKIVTSLIDTVRSEKIPAVFYLEMSSRATADILCEDTSAKPLMLHSCQNITKDEYNRGESYISLMTKNAENLKEALSICH